MHIHLTQQQLADANACESGIAVFLTLYPDGSASVEWTRDEQIVLLRGPLGKYLTWAWRSGFLPWWTMSQADLREADLRGADLRRADLRGADLRGTDLRGADLRGADLRRAELYRADLHKTDLRGANLREANLRGASICVCDDPACVALRITLKKDRWETDAMGTLSRTMPTENVDV